MITRRKIRQLERRVRELESVSHTPVDLRPAIREEIRKQTKVGCSNFQFRSGGFCGNCGFHMDQHGPR